MKIKNITPVDKKKFTLGHLKVGDLFRRASTDVNLQDIAMVCGSATVIGYIWLSSGAYISGIGRWDMEVIRVEQVSELEVRDKIC